MAGGVVTMHNSQCTIHNYDKAADLQNHRYSNYRYRDVCGDCFGLAELQRDTDGDDTVGGMATRGYLRGHSDKDGGDV